MSSPIIQQKQTVDLKQHQRLLMLPKIQQAIHLLQVPVMELSSLIDMELERNPLLEYVGEDEKGEGEESAFASDGEEQSQEAEAEKEVSFDDKDLEILLNLDEEYRDIMWDENYSSKRSQEEEDLSAYQESLICQEPTLFEHLMEQAQATFEKQEQRALAEALIGNFDEKGFLTTPLSDIALLNNSTEEELASILSELKTFTPYGVGAFDMRESFLIQLRCMEKEHSLAFKVIENYYEDLLHNRLPVISKGLKCSLQELKEIIDTHIAKLDTSPGGSFSRQSAHFIIPDVILRVEEGGKVIAEVHEDSIPSLKLNHRYLRMLKEEGTSEETKEFIRHHINSAKWLLHSIFQRNNTLLRISEALVDRMKDYFLSTDGKLIPLTMKVIADELSVHESTIARTVSNKYMATPRGLVAMRSLFTNAYSTAAGAEISSNTVKDALMEIIKGEDKRKPLSDEALSKALQGKGIPCARRTVTKYRQQFNIGNVFQRKKFGTAVSTV